jgi:hypothetical protein
MTTGRRMGGEAGRRWEGGWEAEQAGEGEEDGRRE